MTYLPDRARRLGVTIPSGNDDVKTLKLEELVGGDDSVERIFEAIGGVSSRIPADLNYLHLEKAAWTALLLSCLPDTKSKARLALLITSIGGGLLSRQMKNLEALEAELGVEIRKPAVITEFGVKGPILSGQNYLSLGLKSSLVAVVGGQFGLDDRSRIVAGAIGAVSSGLAVLAYGSEAMEQISSGFQQAIFE